ncbi:MAG: alpha/beta fold hydrolase [Chloroflexaceae bacterium]|nr:alpha/beta fold hydrolase [Chloroflexaceae bacterium]
MNDPIWLDRNEYPFESRFWQLPAGKMHYIDVGSGNPIVFVHGIPTWSFLYRRLIRHLSEQHRCIAIDHLGFGLSDKPTTFSYHPQALASHLETLINGLDLRNITLVVHDWGGSIGLPYALRYPHNVQRMILFNTWMWSIKGDQRAERFAALLTGPWYSLLNRWCQITTRVFVPQSYVDKTKLTPTIHRHYIEPLRHYDDQKGAQMLARAILWADDTMAGLWEQRQQLATIPTLILWGLRDMAFSRQDMQRWADLFAQGQVHPFDHVGHFPQEELEPQVLYPLVDAFLA